ncbi:hypothetical protein diail_4423 [Diaporthe ilicicola]|nr:hypothetical protein diail_4423 [Diaporthe ilicicola]
MLFLQYFLLLISAACWSAKHAAANASETTQSTQSTTATVPPTIESLRPFRFPKIYNKTATFPGLPEFWLYCSTTSEVISAGDIDDLVKGEFAQSTIDFGMIASRSGWVWTQGKSQIYICNYNRLFNSSISVGVYKKVSGWLDVRCGKANSGYIYFDTPWDVAIGRDSTNPDVIEFHEGLTWTLDREE